MGIAVPATIFFLLGLHTPSEFFTIAATTFLAWGLADLLASILERRASRTARRGWRSKKIWNGEKQ